jgi:ferredoxin
MIIKLDSDACQGHGRCYALASDVFESDDEGYAVLKVTGVVPESQREAARLAADNCPEFAIHIDD